MRGSIQPVLLTAVVQVPRCVSLAGGWRLQLVAPHPPHAREDIQEPFVREQEIDPKTYYPKGYYPELLEKWPVEGDLAVPLDDMPPALKKSMSDRWGQKVRNQKVLEDQAK